MAHSIGIKIPKMQVLNSDVEFVIREDGRLLGRLKVSQGNLEWMPAGNSVRTYKVRWRDLTEVIQHRVKPTRRN